MTRMIAIGGAVAVAASLFTAAPASARHWRRTIIERDYVDPYYGTTYVNPGYHYRRVYPSDTVILPRNAYTHPRRWARHHPRKARWLHRHEGFYFGR